jgi:hypothetical protein
VAACVALMAFYVVAASEHGRRVNTSKARGDQTGYLWDAENVYANWHGRQPPTVIGERNRMPLYAGFLALFYRPDISDPDFFEVAKRANIYLSLGLLVALALIFFRQLPPPAAVNLTGIVAFGFFIFKAGYAQSELLFYFLMFITFLGCWHLLRTAHGWRAVGLAAGTGAAAGLAHLTKAAMMPFVTIFLAVYGGATLVRAIRGAARTETRDAAWRAAAAVALAVAFLAVLWPYLSTSKRVFGQYFYNVNSNFYMWYDGWAQASVGTLLHGDGVGWPSMPDAELPGPGRYWQEHTVGQIARRVGSGFVDMGVKSYQMYEYLPYLLLYGGMFLIVLATRRQIVGTMLKRDPALAVFLGAYAVLYLLAIAFYYPTSGTGTGRFLLAHLTPLFFALSVLFSSERLARVPWRIGSLTFGLGTFNALVMALLAVDVSFHLWPRLMTTYGGF